MGRLGGPMNQMNQVVLTFDDPLPNVVLVQLKEGESTNTADTATPYFFGQTARLSSAKAALYREAADQIGRDISASLDEWLNGFTVETGPLLEADTAEPLDLTVEDFDTVSLTIDGLRQGSVLVEQSLGLALVTALLGGANMSSGPVRPLTTIEGRVLDLLNQRFLEAAAGVVLIDSPINVERRRDTTFSSGDEGASSPRIGFQFTLQGPSGGGRLVLAFEVGELQTFSDTIDRRLTGRRALDTNRLDPAAARALGPVPVPLAVRLGQVRLTAGEVVGLQPGDVIRTKVAVASDLVASVDNVDLFTVELGTRGHQMIATILAPIGPHSFPTDQVFPRTATA